MADKILDTMRRMSGRAGAAPPVETPDDFSDPDERTGIRKRTVEIDDDLTDALRAANKHLENILENEDELPDSALPEIQQMGRLMQALFQVGQQENPTQTMAPQFEDFDQSATPL